MHLCTNLLKLSRFVIQRLPRIRWNVAPVCKNLVDILELVQSTHLKILNWNNKIWHNSTQLSVTATNDYTFPEIYWPTLCPLTLLLWNARAWIPSRRLNVSQCKCEFTYSKVNIRWTVSSEYFDESNLNLMNGCGENE